MKSTVAALLCLAAMCWTAASNAASPIQVFVVIENDPETVADDVFESRNLRWGSENRPVEFVLHREISEQVLLPVNNPDELSAGDIKRMIERAIDEWNDLPGTSLEMDEFLRNSDFIIDDRFPFGPDRAALDSFNLITFLNPDRDYTEFDDSGFATTSIFYMSRDLDLSEVIDPTLLEFVIGQNEATGAVLIDFDGDLFVDANLDRRPYAGGEILDADIVFNQTIPFRGFPEDQDHLPEEIPFTQFLGEPDIQALVTRELGHAMGADTSLVPTSIMYSEYASKFDPDSGELSPNDGRFLMNPYEGRDLSQQLDAQVMAAILYPSGSSSTGGISGVVYRGSEVDTISDDAAAASDVLQQVPIFVGRVRPIGSGDLQINDFPSNRGIIRLEANVLSGLDIKFYRDRFQGATAREDGSYLFMGLPPASDYGLRLSVPTGFGAPHGAPTIYSEVFPGNSNADEVIPEWWGGANLTPIYSEDNISNETRGDGFVSNKYVFASMDAFGSLRGGFTNAQTFLSRSELTFKVTTSSGTIESTQNQLTFDEIIQQTLESDEEDAMFVAFEAAGGLLGVVQSARLVDFGATGTVDDIEVTLEIFSFSAEAITVSTRMVLTALMGFPDDEGGFTVPPPVVNGTSQFVATPIAPVPASFETWDNFDAPRIRSIFRMQGAGITSPSRFQVISRSQLARDGEPYDFTPDPFLLAELVDDGGELFPGTFEEIAAEAMYWDNRPLGPGETLVLRFVFGAAQYDRIPETGQPLEDIENPRFLDDDAFVSTPVAVASGSITPKIDFINNDGDPQLIMIPGFDGNDGDDGGPDGPDDEIDPSDDLPGFGDESPANGGNAVPDEDLFTFGGTYGDLDNDGDLDMFVAVSARSDDQFAGAGLANRLYINRFYDRDETGAIVRTGQRRFDDVTFGGDGVPGTADDRIPFQQDATFSAVFGDFDGDADLDIYVLNFGGPGGSNPFDILPGRQNRILINLGGVQGGVAGTFVDGTDRFDPGMHNVGPNTPYPSAASIGGFPPGFPPRILRSPFQREGGLASWHVFGHFDVSTSGAVGDVNNDGLLDIIVGNSNLWMDVNGTAAVLATSLFEAIVYTETDMDGVETAVDPQPIFPGELHTFIVPLWVSERVLINQGFDGAGEWLGFRDETLGTDDLFGGGDFTIAYSSGEAASYMGEDSFFDDRLPPVYPNFRLDDVDDDLDKATGESETTDGQNVGNFEMDVSWTSFIGLAPLHHTGGTSLDIYVANRRELGEPVLGTFRVPYAKYSGNNVILTNLDLNGDGVADGFFQHYNPGSDGTLPGFVVEEFEDAPPETRNFNSRLYVVHSYSGMGGLEGIDIVVSPLAPAPRYDGDPQDVQGGDPDEVNFLNPRLDHTTGSAIADFDYRGHFNIFNVNIQDGGLNASMIEPNPGRTFGAGRGGFAGHGHFGSVAPAYLPDPFHLGIGRLNPTGLASIHTVGEGAPVLLGRPQGVTTADFNLDGDYDLVSASDTFSATGADTVITGEDPGGLQYFDNNNTGVFTEQTATLFAELVAGRFGFIAAADLDNDSDADLFSFTIGQGVRVLYNSLIGSGPNSSSRSDFFTFYDATNQYLHPAFLSDVNPGSLNPDVDRINVTSSADFGDINGDGHIDLVVGRGAFNTVAGDLNDLFLNVGNQPPGVGTRMFRPLLAAHPVPQTLIPFTFALKDPTSAVQFFDATGDGFVDLIVLNRGTSSEFYHNVDGEDNDPMGLNTVAIDFNGDLPDGVFARLEGALPFPVDEPSTRQSLALAVADFDPLVGSGPGTLDIVIGNGPNVRNLLFLNDGGGVYVDGSAGLPRIFLEGTTQDGDDTRGLAAADFNGDGFNDLFVLNRFDTSVSGPLVVTKESSRIFFGDGTGTFVDATAGADGIMRTADDLLPFIPGEVTSITVADFDLAGSPTEDLDGNGYLTPNELEFFPALMAAAPAGGVPVTDGGIVEIPFTFDNTGTVGDVKVSVNIAHTAMGSISLTLRSPDGTQVLLFDRRGASGDNMNTTVFDDSAINAISGGTPPFGGRFRPEQPLSAFDGQSLTGEWGLIVRDFTAGADFGNVNSAVVSITTPRGQIDRVEPFVASYDLFITRANAPNVLLLNDGSGRFSIASGIPSDSTSSYASTAGNIYLRSRRETHGSMTIDRPLIDIIVGNDALPIDGNSATLLLNNATIPGTFSDISHEIPVVTATLIGSRTTDNISGNVRAVRLADVDNDGDLDLFMGQAGRFTTLFAGATDWMLINRVIGDNLLAQSRVKAPGTPATVLATVSPGGAARGETRTLTVYGANFEPGMSLDFGDDVEVLQYLGVSNTEMYVRVRVAPNAVLGSRYVIARNVLGLTYPSQTRIFTVTSTPSGATAAQEWDLYR